MGNKSTKQSLPLQLVVQHLTVLAKQLNANRNDLQEFKTAVSVLGVRQQCQVILAEHLTHILSSRQSGLGLNAHHCCT